MEADIARLSAYTRGHRDSLGPGPRSRARRSGNSSATIRMCPDKNVHGHYSYSLPTSGRRAPRDRPAIGVTVSPAGSDSCD